MADPSSPYDTIKATAVRFMDSYNAAFSQRDVSLLSSTLTPDCARSVAPASFLPSLGVNNVSLSNAEYEAIVQAELPAMEAARVQVARLAVDPVQKCAFVTAAFHITLKGRPESCLEFVFLLDMAESGDRIKGISQFLDTAECIKERAVIRDILSAPKGC
jgi:hypothetical protein